MTILISNQNQNIIKNLHKSVKFTERTVDTSTFKVNEKTFNKIYASVKSLGYNPYAIMYW